MEIIIKEPLYLLFLLFIPIMVFLHYYFFEHIKQKAMKFSNFSAMKRVTGTKLITKNNLQLILRILIFIIFILSLSQPFLFIEKEVSEADFVIAIDISASMLSDDVKPDRLTVAKESASIFIDSVDEANFGLVAFSGVSFIKAKLTNDKIKLKQLLQDLNVELSGGTDIGSALINSINILENNLENNNQERGKVIILITDGSDTSGSFIEESIDSALDYVKKSKVIVHTIGIGTGLGKSYVDLNPIYDKSTLEKIAESTGGTFYEVKSTSEITSAFKEIKINKIKANVPYELKNNLFILGLILLFFEWFLLNTRFRALP
ncbi:MAG: VWA domain-containing protein [Candidatus Woesearchaeota archaeon]